jgi:transcriptional regulator with XRE-family HTH domain
MAMKTKLVTVRVVDTHALYQDIGRRIKAARQRAGLSQQQAATSMGMSRVNLANIEGAAPQRILLEHVYNAALLFDVPVSRLLP